METKTKKKVKLSMDYDELYRKIMNNPQLDAQHKAIAIKLAKQTEAAERSIYG